MRRSALLAFTTVLLFGLAAGAAAQPVPPHAGWRTLDTEHFRVTFGPGLEDLARHAAEVSERAYTRLSPLVARPPSGRIDVLLADHVDVTNGFATTFPSNRIVVFAKPPVDEAALAYNRDWMELVITHELAHVFHLDRTGRLGALLRGLFGRVPMVWPVFPVLGTPGWSIEGLAVVAESELTGAGRAHGSFHEMVVRTAALGGSFDRMDRLNAGSPIWPGGQRAYIYGSLFLDHITETYGEDALSAIVERTADAAIPPFLFFDRIGRLAFGVPFGRAYDAWRATVSAEVETLADSLRAQGLTEFERLTEHSWYATHPRLSPDGRSLAYAAFDGREAAATRVLDSETGERMWQQRRNGLGGLSWLPDASGIVVSQLEYTSTYQIRQDLYVVTRGSGTRITHDGRLQDPDVASDGVRIVAVENAGGTNRLVVVDRLTGAARALTDFAPAVHWAFPRWSPAGDRIAASRFTQGGEYDVVVLDTTGAERARLTADRAIDAHATWSPDGRWILFSSDRTGIANLYAASADGTNAPLRQVTNVLTGAFHPDVSADGRWIHFSYYDDDGFHVARMPFDPASWRDPAPVRLVEPAVPDPANGDAAGTAQVGEPRGYSALRTARPHFWAPVILDEGEMGAFVGATTAGSDLVGRLGWGVSAAVHPGSGRWQGGAAISLGHLGNPRFELVGAREWDELGQVTAEGGIGVEQEDAIGVFATFTRPRWRSSAAVSLGAERVVRTRSIDRAPGVVFTDPRDELVDLVARFGFANHRAQPFSISREDGIALNGRVERRIDTDRHPEFPRDRTELTGQMAGYKALHPSGFANHVAAVRASGLVRTDDGAAPERIGGASGTMLDVLGFGAGSGSLLLPVRGFDRGVRWGTRAWTASAEYRMPVALIGRRPRWSPLYFDRISALAFADAGDAWCTGAAIELYASRCGTTDDGTVPDLAPLVSTGAELVLDVALGYFVASRVRIGFAVPVNGPEDRPRVYFQVGSSF